MVKYWISNTSKAIKAVFLELGTTNEHHKRNKMTLLGMLPWQRFCRWCYLIKNWNSQFFSETKNHLAQPIRWKKLRQCENFVCFKQDPLAHLRGYKWSWKSCYGNITKGVILFLLWWTFVVPSFKNTASLFPEIFFIQYFNIF